MKRIYILLIILPFFLLSCAKQDSKNIEILNKAGENFVVLALSLGDYDENYVDAYFGPDSLKTKAKALGLRLDDIKSKAKENLAKIQVLNIKSDSLEYRKNFLINFYQSLLARADFLSGKKTTFDEESKAIYGVVAPHFDSKFYAGILSSLDSILPKGNGTIAQRLADFKKLFIIPETKVDTVFKTAIVKAHQQTLKFIKMPADENFKLEFVKGKSWGAYNWFKGNSQSLIQVNTEVPIYIDRPIDLACHEGYPGHHVFHSTIERDYVKKRGWVEFSIYPLFSPMSLVSEGAANAGINIAFEKTVRRKFEKQVLFPLAGIDTTYADKYFKVIELLTELENASTDIARDYLDGKISKEKAKDLLINYKLQTPERADMNIKFYEIYRSYIINYTLGQKMIENYLAKKNSKTEKDRWQEYYKLLQRPPLPKDLLTNE
jgi:hypothetical protein